MWRQLDLDMTGQMECQEKTFLKMCSFVTLFSMRFVALCLDEIFARNTMFFFCIVRICEIFDAY